MDMEMQLFSSPKKENRGSKVAYFVQPADDIKDIRFGAIHQIDRWLSQHQSDKNLKLWRKLKRGVYTYYRCRYCSCSISFRRYQDRIQLIRLSSNHTHSTNIAKFSQQFKFRELLKQVPPNMSYGELRTLVASELHIPKRRFYYLYGKIHKQRTFTQVLEELDKKLWKTRFTQYQEERLPEVFVASSPNMMNWYEKWGDCISFDLTYNLLRVRTPGNRQWGVGFFTGFDSNMRLVIFGICLMSTQKTSDFVKVFSTFFEMMGSQPQTIISDEQAAITAALRELKLRGIFHGNHLLDSFHILRNIRKKINKDNLAKYKTLVSTSYFQQYQQTITQLSHICNQDVLQNFIRQSHRVCMSQIPKTFVGLGLSSSSRNEKINDLMKSKVPHQTSVSALLFAIERLQKQLKCNIDKPVRQNRSFEYLFRDAKIREVREVLQKKAFQTFVGIYSAGLRSRMLDRNEGRFVIEYKGEKATVQIINTGFVCSCLSGVKTGLICLHIIKLINQLQSGDSYLKYVNQRWHRANDTVEKGSAGRPKNSRRNIMK